MAGSGASSPAVVRQAPARGVQPLLAIRNLRVEFYSDRGKVPAVQDVSWDVRPGETLGIVGESGSGKSVTALAAIDLIPVTGRISVGEFWWKGEQVDRRRLAELRGSRITMVFQDPMSSLNPLVPVGRQVTEVLRKHKGMSRAAAKARAAELFDLVGIPEPKRRLRQYPFEFSGGMAQRALIAMALAPEPDLLIADEPTTALDVTIQAQILALLARLQDELGFSVILITHDLGVVAGVADRIAVMYAGRVVERGTAAGVFAHPSQPYTEGLLASTPHPHDVRDRLVPIPGNPPVVTKLFTWCPFADRCVYATDVCRDRRPELEPPEHYGAAPLEPDREVACWHAL